MTNQETPLAVRVVDLDVPIWHLARLLVKVALASIPAVIILSIYIGGLVAVFGLLMAP